MIFQKLKFDFPFFCLVSLLIHSLLFSIFFWQYYSKEKLTFSVAFSARQRAKKIPAKDRSSKDIIYLKSLFVPDLQRELKLKKINDSFSSSEVKYLNKAIQNKIIYPRLAIRMQWEGSLRLQVTVTKAGTVENISIAKSTNHKVLDQAAIKALNSWEFSKSLEKKTFPLHFVFSLH